ncbi:proline racemase, partial [Streptomyces sp. JV184]|nr:proline racemase [Streptomyces sp. JV184]
MRVHTADERITAVDFLNVPSYRLAERVTVTTSRGDLAVDVAY